MAKTAVLFRSLSFGDDMNVGLVLSGGAAKGAYEIGALKAISEYLAADQIKYISAASIGVINSYAFSCGRLDYAFNMYKDINKHYQQLFFKTVLTSDYFKSAINEIAADRISADKFYVSLLNLKGFKNSYINIAGCEKELREAYLKAAVAVPPIVKPVSVEGNTYADGGFIDYIPVYPLLDHHIDYVICVHFDKYEYAFESPDFDKKTLKIVFNDDSEILKKTLWFTRSDTEQMLENGYVKAKRILEYVFSNGVDDLEEIYSKIAYMNSLKPKKQPRLTADIAANSITKVARKFARIQICE